MLLAEAAYAEGMKSWSYSMEYNNSVLYVYEFVCTWPWSADRKDFCAVHTQKSDMTTILYISVQKSILADRLSTQLPQGNHIIITEGEENVFNKQCWLVVV